MSGAQNEGAFDIAVVGAGAWGTALANAWAAGGPDGEGRSVLLLARDADTADRIEAARENGRYLPDVPLHPMLAVGSDPAWLAGVATVAMVVPTQALAGVSRALAPHIGEDAAIIGCAKGIERASGRLPHAILSDALPGRTVAALSGPSFAADVARGLPTAVTIAARMPGEAQTLAARLATPALRPYASDDLTGVEAGGALKNVLAIAVGIARGLALGASAEAALVARGFAEMARLAEGLGGRRETLAGLSGLGDLVLSCAPGSRNFACGEALARDEGRGGMKGAAMEGRPLAEGAFTARMAVAAARERDIDVPIMATVDAVLEGTLTPGDAVTRLLARPLRDEA